MSAGSEVEWCHAYNLRIAISHKAGYRDIKNLLGASLLEGLSGISLSLFLLFGRFCCEPSA